MSRPDRPRAAPAGARSAALAAALAAVLVAGCADTPPAAPRAAAPAAARAGGAATVDDADPGGGPPPPAPLAAVPFGGGTLAAWPYTGQDFTGTPQDPINAVLTGHAEPLRIRAALRRLDGDRSRFGFAATGNSAVDALLRCTWRDAVGDEQTAYGAPEGWTGSAVQLACGEYSPLRFHVRLFRQGAWTLAGAHVDLHVTGTSEHQVVSWELAEQLLAADLLRSGVLAGPPALSDPISQAPTFREVPAPIYAAIPAGLRQLVGLAGGRGIPNDGRARLFDVAVREPVVPDLVVQQFTIQFDRAIPKPFCAGPADVVLVRGPLHFAGVARVTGGGTYHREHRAVGALGVVPVDPATGQPSGPARGALVTDEHRASVTPGGARAEARLVQRLFDARGALRESLDRRLGAGTRGVNDLQARQVCER
jgi:hypothetical protein